MLGRCWRVVGCVVLLAGVGWLAGRAGQSTSPTAGRWTEVVPGVWRSPGQPAGYALVQGGRALLIDAPSPPEGLLASGVRQIEIVLLTHHHRDSLKAVPAYQKLGAKVRAPKTSAAWLTPEGVARYWNEAIPLRTSRTAYRVVAEGISDIDYSLGDGDTISWGNWSLEVLATPGHSPDHIAILARPRAGRRLLFAGDALTGAGKLPTPYTTDWDHWTDAGLRPAAESLRKLARARPDMLLPAQGEPLLAADRSDVVVRTLEQTAKAVEELGFLKSYERFTRERLRQPPQYAFLAKNQAGSNGSLPWSRLADPLWLTGNTYVLVSRDGPCLVVDPWDPHSAKQIPRLQKAEKIGPVEVVLCSHAHFDHYDGAYTLLERDRPQVWTLDRVALPIAEPFRLRAPFLDARPLTVHRQFRDGETARWREYTLRFHFLPGQTLYTMGVETTIAGKKCLFTADNFFHHDLYSGTGGWMGLNRSGPLLYAASARKVLALQPDWVLAEHGSAMEFNADDFRRRVQWAEVSARAADTLSPSGQYQHDWNPHHVRIEPVRWHARPGQSLSGELVVDNVLDKPRRLQVRLSGRGLLADQSWELDVAAGASIRRKVELKSSDRLAVGRHAFALEVHEAGITEPCDAFVLVDCVKE